MPQISSDTSVVRIGLDGLDGDNGILSRELCELPSRLGDGTGVYTRQFQ